MKLRTLVIGLIILLVIAGSGGVGFWLGRRHTNNCPNPISYYDKTGKTLLWQDCSN